MKYCPTCGYETADDESNLCPICDEEVKLVEKKDDRANMSTKESNKSMEVKGVASGGNTTIIDNSKHVERPLSEAERIAKNKAAYREDCENRCKDGFVSEEDLDYLERQRESLGLERHIAAEILKQAKERSIRKVVKLPDAARIQLNQTRDAIGINDMQSIRHDFDALKQWKTKLDIDELNQLYFQLKSILEPNTFEFEDNEYWSVFWSAVAFKKTGSPNVVESIASLNRWDSFYPQQNQNLISTVSLLMDNRLKEATESFKAITKGFSPDLQSVYDTLDSMLGREWRSLTIDVAPRLRFYSDSLFKNSYDVLKKTAQKNHAEDIARAEEERQRKEEEKNRREKFLEIFESNGGNIDTACFASGLPKVKYIEWLETIPEFAQSVKTVQEKIAKAIKDQEEAAAAAERLAKEIANKKELFKKKYKEYQCNLYKTCNDLSIDSVTISSWRSSDASFDGALKDIQNEYEEAIKIAKDKERKERRETRIKKALKALPWIFAIILFAIVIGGLILRADRIKQEKQIEHEQQEQLEAEKRTQEQKDNFIEAYANNGCDLQKTCVEQNIASSTILECRKRDQKFDEALALIEREDSLKKEEEKQLEEIERAKEKQNAINKSNADRISNGLVYLQSNSSVLSESIQKGLSSNSIKLTSSLTKSYLSVIINSSERRTTSSDGKRYIINVTTNVSIRNSITNETIANNSFSETGGAMVSGGDFAYEVALEQIYSKDIAPKVMSFILNQVKR